MAVMGNSTKQMFDLYYSHIISVDTQSGFVELPLQ